MSVWICIPSIRRNGGALPLWKERGYRVAIVRQGPSLPYADYEIPTNRYLGWAPSINMLVTAVMVLDPDCEYFVGGGDDTEPDPHAPEEIARECSEHFACSSCDAGRDNVPPYCPACGLQYDPSREAPCRSTFGVMQPTGDLALWPGSAIDKFAGSPWMGREFCRRVFGGKGPLWPEFRHMFGDEHLQCVAAKLGVFWQRPDLIHKHEHWGRTPGGARRENIPAFLEDVNSMEHWIAGKALFERLKVGGFKEADNLLP